MEVKIWKNMPPSEKERLLGRSESDIAEAARQVQPIIDDVRRRGDEALRDYTKKFDGANLGDLPLQVQEEEFQQGEKLLSEDVKIALDFAVENVRRFHREQRPGPMSFQEIRPGVYAGEKAMPVPSAGLYVPRGRGSFPSMLYMLAIPALEAEVPRIAVVTPPNPDGSVDPACLYTARILGLRDLYRVGGAQAVAALTYGTDSIPAVAKILGPGSAYVAAAKRLLAHRVDIGLPAGPSESIILADGQADPRLVVLDLLIEAEHGSDSSAILITPHRALAEEVASLLPREIEKLPEPRRTFLRDVFSGYGGIILAESLENGAEIVNLFAPEHLQIQCQDPFDVLPLIRNAGEILLGHTTPFSLANYACGANAVLPTGGRARTYSAVSVRDFVKYSSVVRVSPGAFDEMRKQVEVLADYEGFAAHAEALRRRSPRGDMGEPAPR